MTTPQDDKIPLGRSGLRVAPLGVGTWQWGDNMLWGYGSGYAEPDIRAAFDASIEAGIDFFDTAEVYGRGQSERFLGAFIGRNGRRPTVATKFFPLPWRLTRPALSRALLGSLERLELEKVELYQIHWPLPVRSVETWAHALADTVEAGLSRAVGVSNYSASQTRRAHAALAARGLPLATNQVQYSLLDRSPERNGLLETCQELGVTLIAYSPLAKGLLTGKYTPANPPPGLRGRSVGRERLARIQPLIGLLREIGGAHGDKSPAQVALNWLISKGVLPIPGAKNARQARDNAGALGWRLSADEVAALERAANAVTLKLR